jgi:hypothetical protein
MLFLSNSMNDCNGIFEFNTDGIVNVKCKMKNLKSISLIALFSCQYIKTIIDRIINFIIVAIKLNELIVVCQPGITDVIKSDFMNKRENGIRIISKIVNTVKENLVFII